MEARVSSCLTFYFPFSHLGSWVECPMMGVWTLRPREDMGSSFGTWLFRDCTRGSIFSQHGQFTQPMKYGPGTQAGAQAEYHWTWHALLVLQLYVSPILQSWSVSGRLLARLCSVWQPECPPAQVSWLALSCISQALPPGGVGEKWGEAVSNTQHHTKHPLPFLRPQIPTVGFILNSKLVQI